MTLRIAHTADIHIRSLSRHDEYREVFTEFIKDCKKNKADHIFIGGDIFHTKTSGISPEYIEFLTWWLEAMSKVAPVHLTLGNHDGNLVNLSRQDAVSPIVAALDNPRIHLYKKSGMYEFHPGYTWCIYSLFDEEGWKEVKPVAGKVNIACYHGPVRGSKTETGWELDDGLTTDFFKNYPFVLLGDIHKRQHLAYRDDKPWISYAGTPLQQNYAEELEHGYLLWDIDDESKWDVSFRKLPNPKPYVTLTWSGSTEDVIKEASNYPDGSRFRIRSSQQLTQKDFRDLNENLKGKKLATEVTFKSDFVIDKSIVKTGSTTLAKADLRSPDVLTKLVKDFHKSSQFSEETWDSALEQVKSYLSTVANSEESTRNSKWTLRCLEFDNMFTYGPKNFINFDKLNGIVGIFGSNRLGKSSVVGTLMYSLFNTTDRGPMKNLHVCNIRKPYCSSKVLINHNGTDYVIERQTTKSENKKGVTTAATALNLFRINDDGEAEDLAGEQRTDTEKAIKTLIGNHEDFLMTSLSAQGEINQFISQGSTKRRAILSRFLDLDIFDKMHELANKEVNVLKAQLKNFPPKEWLPIIEKCNFDLEECERTIDNLTKKSQEEQIKLSQLQLELSKHKDTTPITRSQVETYAHQVTFLEKQAKSCQDSIQRLEEETQDYVVKLETIKNVKAENNITVLRARLDAYKKLETSLSTLRHIHEKESTQLKQFQKSLKILDEVPCGDDYPSCKFIKDAHINKEKMSTQSEKVEQALKNLNEAQSALDIINNENVLERVNKMEKLLTLESKLQLDLSRKETELARIKSSCDKQRIEMTSARDRLKLLEEALKKEENAEAVSIKSNMETLSESIKLLDSMKFEAATKKGKLAAELEKLREEKTIRDDLLEKMKVHDLVASAFSKRGIPTIITKSQLPAINAEVAKILHGIVDFSIELENDEESDSSEIYINYGDSRRIIELCSGMEKTIASLAIRVAMINVSSLPRPNIFIIDEGFGTLDDASVEACNRLLTSLKRYFRVIIVITHVDGIKDVVDHVLEITKNEKDARISYGEES